MLNGSLKNGKKEKRYVLQVLKNENDHLNIQKGQFAYVYKPDPEECTGFGSFTTLEHVSDVFNAQFFKTLEQAKTVVKKHASWGVEYYIATVELVLY